MKSFSILSAILLSVFVAGCSYNNGATPDKTAKQINLKKDRDYLATVSRSHQLHIIDGKENRLVKSCNLKGTIGSGGLVISSDGTKAYVLQDNWQAVYGYDLNSCENIFSAKFSSENIRAMSIFSFALSNDGKQLYTISNPTKMLNDRYKVLDPVFKIFNTADGLDAKAVDSFKAPRQITVMATAKDGSVYASGPQIYKINPKTHEVSIGAKLRGWERKNYSNPDVLAMWPIGNVSNEFLLMYTAAKFKDETMNPDTADYVWGATRIDLNTGKVEQEDFAPLESVMFTGMTNPKDSNILYGVLTDLTKFDRKNQKVLKRVYLDHSYYCINFSTDGSKIYLGGTFNDIAVYNPDTLEKVTNIVLPSGDVAAGTLQVFRVK
ncbi:quinohemoprotein amine dehydrogenase subunit beta [Halarcobacter anaerophilus]|uniref:quinohemoprotein amine dehydrogenase subunit beta n=1 Tax=Halarcobacter anaerophilus TaxID=877500 RepID=UPI0005C9AD15|nr:quinohemoprotein amine dehydrogenase subunit beta [Halarcobacter anaerophilus]